MPKVLLMKTISVLHKTRGILTTKNGMRTLHIDISAITNTIVTRGISGKVITSAQIMTESLFATNTLSLEIGQTIVLQFQHVLCFRYNNSTSKKKQAPIFKTIRRHEDGGRKPFIKPGEVAPVTFHYQFMAV